MNDSCKLGGISVVLASRTLIGKCSFGSAVKRGINCVLQKVVRGFYISIMFRAQYVCFLFFFNNFISD